ncbi:hypothetical protein D3C71_1021210 [compost metagenome]
MPRQLQTVTANMLRRLSLPMPQHALMQKRISPQQRLIKTGQGHSQARMRTVRHLNAHTTQPLPSRLLRRQSHPKKHLTRRPPQTPGDVAHQSQRRRIQPEEMRQLISPAQVQANLPIALLQFRLHVVGHLGQELSEARETGAQGGGGVQQNVQALQAGGRHAVDQFTAKRGARPQAFAFMPQLFH